MDPLILLHGALGTSEQFDFILPQFKEHFDVHRLDFEGHGEAGTADSPFRVAHFAENILGYMDEHDLEKVNLFGYSMGGYVALTLAKNYPQKINKVATLGTILQWDEEVAERECRYLHPKKIKEKVPHFAKKLEERHSYSWERVVNNTRDMLQYLGVHPEIKETDWKQIDTSLRLHVGDQDTTAGLAETVDVYKKMEKSELMVLPETGHPINEIDKDLMIHSLKSFFGDIEKSDLDDRAQKKNGSKN